MGRERPVAFDHVRIIIIDQVSARRSLLAPYLCRVEIMGIRDRKREPVVGISLVRSRPKNQEIAPVLNKPFYPGGGCTERRQQVRVLCIAKTGRDDQAGELPAEEGSG